MLDSCLRLDIDLKAVHNSVIVGIFSDTADSVSAHGALTAILIEHAHPAVCDLRRTNHDQTVRSDSKMAVAHKP